MVTEMRLNFTTEAQRTQKNKEKLCALCGSVVNPQKYR